MSSLPEDIFINIFTRLPLKSLSRFRCVCKSWSNLFRSPNFVKQQFNHSLKHRNPGILIDCSDFSICYVDYDSVSETVSSEVIELDYPVEYKHDEILGVCNGLICYRTKNEDIIIRNPYTKDYRKLPIPPNISGLTTKNPMIQYGFGYDARTEDYKFAMMVNCESARYSELNVYSLAANSWKTMVNIPFVYRYKQLILFNGIFHWIESPNFISELPAVIGSFDLENETFKEIQLPPELLDTHKFSVLGLCLLEGCLYLIGSIYKSDIEVWMMKEYSVKESWTKMFTIDGEKFDGAGHVNLKNSLGNGVIVVQIDGVYPYLYDFNKEEARELEINGISPPFFAWAFLGSLVSPSFGTSLGTQYDARSSRTINNWRTYPINL